MALTWHSLLDDPTKQLEWVVKIDSLDPSDDSLESFYILSPNSGRTDTPTAPLAATIADPGSLSEGIGEDNHYSGIASTDLATLTLTNAPLPGEDAGPLDGWTELVFAGYHVTYYLLEVGVAFGSPDPFRVATMRAEPIFEDDEVSIELESILARLDRTLDNDRYVGIPTCIEFLTGSSQGSAPSNAVYNVKSYTVMFRFRMTAVDTTSVTLMRRGITATNREFNLFIRNSSLGSPGCLDFQCSFGGVNTTVARTTARVDDDEWHEVIAAVLDLSDAYLMVDGVVIDRVTPAASVNNPGDAVNFGIGGAVDRKLQDCRIFKTYYDEEDAKVLYSTPGDITDPSLIALWNFDDNSGATATDYSVTANNASISGVVNTDYRWISSDLGLLQLTGMPVLWGYGRIFNAAAHMINSTDGGGRYRFNEDAGFLASLVVKSRGAVLTLTTDYTLPGDGVIRMVAAQADPVTFDTGTSSLEYSPEIASEIMDAKGGLESTDIDQESVITLSSLAPMPSSYWTDQDITCKDVLNRLVGGISGYVNESYLGSVSFGMLLPPCGPSPRDGIYTLESRRGAALLFGDVADQTGSFSLAAWIKPWRTNGDTVASATSDEVVVSKLSATDGYYLKLPIAGSGQVRFGFLASSVDNGVSTNEGVIKWGQWQFVVGVFDAAADTLKIYCGLQGSTLVEVASATGITAVPSNTSANLSVGAKVTGVVHEVSVWSKALSLVEAQGIMDAAPTVPTTNLAAYIPLDEGSGNAIEEVSTNSVSVGTNTWQPEYSIDLSQDPEVSLHLRQVQQLRRVRVRYRHNYRPMTPADIVSSVSTPNRWDLIRPYRSVTAVRKNLESTHPRAKDMELTSPVVDGFNARRLGRLMLNRMSPGRQVGYLNGLDRRSIKLTAGTSEVYIVSPRYGLSSGGHFRVTTIDKDLGELSSNALLWR